MGTSQVHEVGYGFGMKKGCQLDQSLPLRLFKSVFESILLKHGGLPHILPLAVLRADI